MKKQQKELEKIGRKNRGWYPGQILHIMNRGGSHQNIFKDESDYQYMLRLLQSTKEKFPFYVHAYCLMTNHYHFLFETLNDDISNIRNVLTVHTPDISMSNMDATDHCFEEGLSHVKLRQMIIFCRLVAISV